MLDKSKFAKELDEHSLISTDAVCTVIALIEIRESVDRYIEQRIKSDKTLEDILKDIYSAVQESGPQN